MDREERGERCRDHRSHEQRSAKEMKRERSPDRRHDSSSNRHHGRDATRSKRSPDDRERRHRSRSPCIKREPESSPRRKSHKSPPSRSGSSHIRRSRSPRRERPSYEPSGKLTEEKPIKWEMPSFKPSGSLSEKEMEKPSFEPSGKLTEDTNTFRGVVIKYNEPPEAQVPKVKWRLYPFKGEEQLPEIFIHRQSAYLIGRERKIADLPVDHPSCSKQHAVIQYRSVPYEREDGSKGRKVRPYIIDLGSGNGTFLNGERIEAQRYIEMMEKDVLKFGFSSREYVLLNENSTEGGDIDSDNPEDGPGIDMAGVEERRMKEEDDMY